MGAPGLFDYGKAVREHAFVQVPLLDLGKFRAAAKERGLETLGVLDAGPWETLDKEDLLTPVAYALHGFAWQYEVEHHLQQGELLIREEVGYPEDVPFVVEVRDGGPGVNYLMRS